MLESIWSVLNSPVGITAVAGVLLFLLNRLYASKPGWAKFEGAIISGIKFAEKAIPSSTTDKGLSKLDAALNYVIRVYEEANRKRPSSKVLAELKEGIQITHNKLEAAGTLKK